MSEIKYVQPSRCKNHQGDMRRVGFELEFAGLSLHQTAQIVAKSLQGKVEFKTEAECTVHTDLGEFQLELDWQFGKRIAKERAQARKEEGEEEDDQWMRWLTKVAQEIVPLEVVCPPIPMDQLQQLDAMVEAMRRSGAVGTRDAPHYAFGVHINPEIPNQEPETLAAYLQAYGLAQDWLIDIHNVDLVRRLTPYIDKYPSSYLRQVMDYSDAVSLEQLIDDYLAHNPTRNRALDMLPLFKFMNEQKIVEALPDPRIKARPTFHYRLPNCEIEKTGWHLNQSWNIWCLVEYLADSEETRSGLIDQWQEFQAGIPLGTPPWHQDLDRLYTGLL
ncbi:amidoligase family protein [Aliiglaciecola sp. CAU 1673]|uniref:amidoligase family protein n=1 Tax=Aliiglaciecola sp. CAU 1673 TaxID=3032595 RepID=UPI0023DA3D34|nr:amidoligase family protein [Aliiglaciecola sp. CAU 1673]MDF2180301.1 amidoligase family protein [Aliiglaciecola sp. CAU 1673]